MANNKAKSTVFQKKESIHTKSEVFSGQRLRFGNHSKDSQQWRPLLLTAFSRRTITVVQNHQLPEPLFIHLLEKRSRVATKASLSRTNEAFLSAVISRLEREQQGLTDGSGEQWHTAEDFRRRDKKPRKRGGLETRGVRSKEKTIGPG
ncbi:unnamed protein product [Brassica rapa subsp. narinosa]